MQFTWMSELLFQNLTLFLSHFSRLVFLLAQQYSAYTILNHQAAFTYTRNYWTLKWNKPPPNIDPTLVRSQNEQQHHVDAWQ